MKKIVLMRGLPGTGKSTRARELAGDEGIIYSTDDYFHTEVNPSKPEEYNFVPRFLAYAHKWNQIRFHLAVNLGKPLIIVDNTNVSKKDFCCSYMKYAHFQDYEIEFAEPTTPWWLETVELLQDKRGNKAEIKKRAVELANSPYNSHKVPHFAFERMMFRWDCNLVVEDVLNDCLENCKPLEETTA